MADILTQEEIDALIQAMSGPAAATGAAAAAPQQERSLLGQHGPPGRRRRIRLYDFRRPDKFNKDHLRTVSMVFENYARLLGSVFAASLRTAFHASLASVDQQTYGEFTRSLDDPAVLALFGMAPLQGTAAVALEPNVAFPMLDRMLGGPGQTVDKPRPLTEIEQTVMERLFRTFLQHLGDSWEAIAPVKTRLEGLESNPLFAQIASPNDVCIVVSVAIEVGSHRGLATFCFPYLLLEPIMSKLSARNWMSASQGEERQETLATAQHQLVQAPVTVTAELGQAELTLREFVSLEPGDVIRLNRLASEELDVHVGGRHTFRAVAGTAGGRIALRITAVTGKEEADGHE